MSGMAGVVALALVAIVNTDQVPLRAAASAQAAQQTVLTQGDSLEVRGRRHEYLQVWDHRRERGGFVRASQVRVHDLVPAQADALRAHVRFLRDSPGLETQGIAYVAAFLKAAPVEAIDAEVFDALGTMAERLARRAAAARGRAPDPLLAAQLEAAAVYGITLRSVDRGPVGGRVQLCYDGDAWRQALARQPSSTIQARAVLALTPHDCIDPGLPVVERQLLDRWRAQQLERIDLASLPEHEKNRVRLRRAGVWAALAHDVARRGEDATVPGQRALESLAAVTRSELAESDLAEYAEAAVRLGASRWAAESAPSAPRPGLRVTIEEADPKQPGQSCVLLTDTRRKATAVLARRCTYGVVWTASLQVNAQGTAATLAVQPLAAWRELWLLHKTGDGKGGDHWRIDVLAPGTDGPDVGYLEAAGWSPDGTRLLTARETVVDGRHRRSFEVLRISTLAVERRADHPEALSAFARGQSAGWKRMTVALR